MQLLETRTIRSINLNYQVCVREVETKKSVKASSFVAAYSGLLWLAQLIKIMIYQSNDSSVLVCFLLFKLPLSCLYPLILCFFSVYPLLSFLLLLKGKKKRESRFLSLLHVSPQLEGNDHQKGKATRYCGQLKILDISSRDRATIGTAYCLENYKITGLTSLMLLWFLDRLPQSPRCSGWSLPEYLIHV